MAIAEREPAGRELRGSGHAGDKVFQGVTLTFALVVILAAAIIVVSLIKQSWPALTTTGLGVLGGQHWNPNNNIFGAIPFIYGTFVTSLLALLIAGIVGVMVAIFLIELAPPVIARPVSFLVEMLAAVPSIIFGLWGIYVLIPIIGPVELWLNKHLGFIPLFGGDNVSGRSLFTASIILMIMILPTITALSRDVMAAVPGSQREGMLALGATRWETVRHVIIPYARAGIIGALILGLGRAVGETMAVTMVVGNTPNIGSLLQGGYSLAAVLANESGEAFGQPLYIGALFELGLLLLLISVLLNTLARLLVWRVNRGGSAAVRG